MFEELIGTVEFQMCLLLFVALGGYLLATRIHQSAVVGEILVGLLVGPSVLGLISYDGFVESLATLGSIVLLFVIGFEFELKEIANWKYFLIAALGVAVPFIGGYIAATCFGMDFYAAVFIGTALTATSIAITANVLREMGKLTQPFAKAIIGAAVIDDVLALIVLSIAKDLSSSGGVDAGGIIFTVIKAFGFVIIGALLGIKFIPKLLAWMDNRPIAKKFPELLFIVCMIIAFFYAMIAELVGVSAIVGAFLAGACVSHVKLKHSMDIKLGSEYLYIIFASIFFVSLGIMADLHYITPDMLIFIAVLCVVAIITKVIGCGLPAKLTGMSWKDSLMVGFGMVPRGEVAMIVGLIALEHFQSKASEVVATDLELYNNYTQIGNEIFIAVVVVSLVTTIIVPLIYNGIFFRKERKDLKKTITDMQTTQEGSKTA